MDTEVKFTRITSDSLPVFLVYLLPQAAALFVRGRDVVSVGAVIDGHTCGAALCTRVGGALRLESLFVDETARRRGLGSELLRRVIAEAAGHWGSVSSISVKYALLPAESAVMDKFLLSFGFAPPCSKDSRMFLVRTEEIRKLDFMSAAFRPDFQTDPHIVPFSALTPQQLDEIENDGSIPGVLKPSGWEGHVLGQGSCVWMERGIPLAYLLAYQGFDGELVMGPAFKREGAPKGAFRALLLALVNRSYYIFGRDFACHIHTITPHSAALVEKLTCGHFTEYLCHKTSMAL